MNPNPSQENLISTNSMVKQENSLQHNTPEQSVIQKIQIQEKDRQQQIQRKQESQSEPIDENEIIKTQIQYHYQDNHQEESSIQEEDDSLDELTSSPMQQKTPISCENEEQPNTTGKKPPKTKSVHKSSKLKRGKNYKCNICKGTGKKCEVIKCYKCKQYMHINCLDVEQGNIPSPYLCQKCNFRQSSKQIQSPSQVEVINLEQVDDQEDEYIEYNEDLTDYTTRTDRIFVEKLQRKGRLNRFDRRNRQFQQFKARYPYYVEGDRIKYPIDDRLFVIYADMLQVEDKKPMTPKQHPIIPSQFLGNLLEIANWLASFEKLLKNQFPECQLPRKIDKQFLYQSFEKQGYDQAFVALFCTMLRLFLADIFEGSRKQNMKMLSESSFFSLLGQIKEAGDFNDEFLIFAGPEIIRQLGQVTSFKSVFKGIIIPQNININTKTTLLIDLLRGLTETNGFKMLATKKTQVIQQLIERKGKLIAQIKQAETGKLQNRQKKKEYQDIMDEQDGSDDEEDKRAKKKNKEKAKKKINQINNQNNLTQAEIAQARQKLNECIRALQFATTETIFLGRDRNGSEYYFYHNEPYRIYVNYRPYLSDPNKVYRLYEGKQTIADFMKGLNSKGVNERRLNHNLSVLTKLNMITEHIEIEGPEPHSIKTFPYEVTKQVILSNFYQIQMDLYQFYQERAMEWTNEQQRAAILQSIAEQANLQKIAEIINSVQEMLLNVDIKTQNIKKTIKKAYGITFQNELRMSQLNLKKKMVMRIWGSNPEKIKKYWCDYILKDPNCVSIWICLYTLKANVDRFMKRKIETQEGQRKRQQKINDEKMNEIKTEINSNILTSRRRPKPVQGVYNEEKEAQQSSQSKERQKRKSARSLRQRPSHEEEINTVKEGDPENNQSSNAISQKEEKAHKKRKRQKKQDDVKESEDKKKKKHKHKKSKQKSEEQPSPDRKEKSRHKQEKYPKQQQQQKSKSKEKKKKRHRQKQEKKLSEQLDIKSPQQSEILPRSRRRNTTLQSEQQSPEEILPTRKKRKHRLTLQSQSENPSQQKQEELQNNQEQLHKGSQKPPQVGENQDLNQAKLCVVCQLVRKSRSIVCFQCQKSYHYDCANISRRPKTEWICASCTNSIRQTRSRK